MFNLNFLHNGKEWFIAHQKNLLLLVGVLAVGTVAFESGLLKGRMAQPEPLVISIPAATEPLVASDIVSTDQKDQLAGARSVALITGEKQSLASCPLVGSKNSNKYHLATCAVAKRIKPENKVCFASKEDAKKRGYLPGCLQ